MGATLSTCFDKAGGMGSVPGEIDDVGKVIKLSVTHLSHQYAKLVPMKRLSSTFMLG